MPQVPAIELRRGLPACHVPAAAELYYDAFCKKLQPVLVSQPRGVRVLEQILVPESAVVALCEGRLVGLSGVLHGRRSFLRPRLAVYCREYGWTGGALRYVVARVLRRWQPSQEVLVEGLVVHPDLRGQGVGTQLLEEIFRYARERSLRAVRLEVVDTNPRARQLYERLGFVAVRTHRFPLLEPLLGFRAVTTMIKPMAPSAS